MTARNRDARPGAAPVPAQRQRSCPCAAESPSLRLSTSRQPAKTGMKQAQCRKVVAGSRWPRRAWALSSNPWSKLVGGHAVAEEVQARMLDARGRPQAREPAGQGAGCHVGRPPRRRAEQPVLLRHHPGRPGLEVAPDHVRRTRPEGHPPDPPRLCRAKDARGQASLDGQDPAVQIRQPQHRQLAPPCSAVRGQADQQQRLLGGKQTLGASRRAGPASECVLRGRDGVTGGRQEAAHLVLAVVAPGLRPGRTAHPGQRVQPEQALGHPPGHRRTQ